MQTHPSVENTRETLFNDTTAAIYVRIDVVSAKIQRDRKIIQKVKQCRIKDENIIICLVTKRFRSIWTYHNAS